MGNVLGELFGDIASAIREKTGDEATMKPAQFPVKIREIEGSAETEATSVDANFTVGDMVIQPSEGKLLEMVTVKKPADLIPENIKLGVDIAGIIGSLVSGGSGDSGSDSPSDNGQLQIKEIVLETDDSGSVAVNHDMGKMPDMVCIFYADFDTDGVEGEIASGTYELASYAMKRKFNPDGVCQFSLNRVYGLGTGKLADDKPTTDITSSSTSAVYCPNDTQICCGGLAPKTQYRVIAISGLGASASDGDEGGGSLPAGLYWQDARPDMPHPTNFNHKIFEFNGNIYAIANTSADGKTKNVCKLNNGAWTTITTFNFGVAYTKFYCVVEYNGKVHLSTGTNHYSFDGSTVKQYASVKDGIGNYPLDYGMFVEDGKLKVASYYTKHTHVWNEATDTWTQEDYAISTITSSHRFYNYNNKVYVAYNKDLYEYSKGVLTLIGNFANSISTLIFYKNHVYNVSYGGYVYKFSLENKTDALIGYVPRYYADTGNMNNECAVLGGQIHVYSGGYRSSFGASNLIMHEVTE